MVEKRLNTNTGSSTRTWRARMADKFYAQHEAPQGTVSEGQLARQLKKRKSKKKAR